MNWNNPPPVTPATLATIPDSPQTDPLTPHRRYSCLDRSSSPGKRLLDTLNDGVLEDVQQQLEDFRVLEGFNRFHVFLFMQRIELDGKSFAVFSRYPILLLLLLPPLPLALLDFSHHPSTPLPPTQPTTRRHNRCAQSYSWQAGQQRRRQHDDCCSSIKLFSLLRWLSF
jgi:hypothetical protein